MSVALRTITRLQDADDINVSLGAGVDEYALCWDNDTARFVLRAVAQTVLDLANARFADVDMDNASAVQMFGALQQAGVITTQQAAMIDALATVPGVSRAAVLGLGTVTEADVLTARDWQIAQEAEAARLATFAALRERLVSGYHGGLAWLQSQFDNGNAAPDWSQVVERM